MKMCRHLREETEDATSMGVDMWSSFAAPIAVNAAPRYN